jgi:hypothetical protein
MAHDEVRPVLDLSAADAWTIADRLAAQLQLGLDTADADAYDAWFGADVVWGNPRGGTVVGYDELNAIHHELMGRGVAPASRFEVTYVRAPTPDVVVTQIRRLAVDADGFSETALYVLVRRDDAWWLVAAQNTPIEASE